MRKTLLLGITACILAGGAYGQTRNIKGIGLVPGDIPVVSAHTGRIVSSGVTGEDLTNTVALAESAVQEIPDVEGTDVLSTGATADYVLTADGAGASTWQEASGGGDESGTIIISMDLVEAGTRTDVYTVPAGYELTVYSAIAYKTGANADGDSIGIANFTADDNIFFKNLSTAAIGSVVLFDNYDKSSATLSAGNKIQIFGGNTSGDGSINVEATVVITAVLTAI